MEGRRRGARWNLENSWPGGLPAGAGRRHLSEKWGRGCISDERLRHERLPNFGHAPALGGNVNKRGSSAELFPSQRVRHTVAQHQ